MGGGVTPRSSRRILMPFASLFAAFSINDWCVDGAFITATKQR
jgi:hypothetical protein